MTYPLKPEDKADAGWGLPEGLSAQAAIEALRRRLVRLAMKLLWNRDDAEEIVQEAFRLAASKGMGPRSDGFGPWMARSTANLALNLRRRRRAQPLADGVELPGDVSPHERAERIESLDRLRRAIGDLPPQQRLAVTLRSMEQMDYSAIAQIMQCSEAAARTHVHLARSRLTAMLTEGGQ